MIYGYIQFLGDSLTTGARDPTGRSFPLEACRILSERWQQTWLPIIDAENDITASDLAKRAPVLMQEPLSKEAVVLIGTNDARRGECHEAAVFEMNLEVIVRSALVAGKMMYICTIPLPSGFGSAAHNRFVVERIRAFNEVIRLWGDKGLEQVSIVDLEPQLAGDEWFADGVHFSRLGTVTVGKIVAEAIGEQRSFRDEST